MGEKGNVAETASGIVDRGVDFAQSGVSAATGAVVAGTTGAVTGVVRDRVEEKIKPDDEQPGTPAAP